MAPARRSRSGRGHAAARQRAIYDLVSLTQKVALGLGVGLLGVLLDVIGYRANAAQPWETLEGIRILSTLVPAALGATGAAVIAFYPLGRACTGGWSFVARRRSAGRLG